MQQNPATDTVTSVPLENLGQGTYSITIEVPYIYIGPHKRGEDCSLLLQIKFGEVGNNLLHAYGDQCKCKALQS